MSSLLHSNSRGTAVEWLDYDLNARGPGQFDDLTAVLEGYWDSPWAAYLALAGRKVTLPGQPAGYGFYVADGSLRTAWAKGGRVRAEFTATGLCRQKWKRTKLNTADAYSLSSVTVGTPAPPGLPAGTYPHLNFRNTKPGYDVTVGWAVSGSNTLDLATAGKQVTSHWAATLAGISLGAAPGTNPFSGAEVTAYYPNGWYYDISSSDSVGEGKLMVATFAFRHQWFYTL